MKKMIFNVLHKHNDKKCKNHLSEQGSFVALCTRKQVQNTGGSVEVINRKWFMEGTIPGDYSIHISEYELRDNYCAYCVAIAHCKERSYSHAV